jgi:hypothetical protein
MPKLRFAPVAVVALAALCLAGCPPASTNVPVTGVSIDNEAVTIAIGTTFQITGTVAPLDATDAAVTWTVGDPAVISISDTGLVTAGKAGTTTVTVTTADGEFTASCEVTVKTFFAGAFNDGASWFPCTWENGALHSLKGDLASGPSWAHSPAVYYGGKIYAAGFYQGKVSIPCYWEGDSRVSLQGSLTDDAHAMALTVSGGTVYSAGYYTVTIDIGGGGSVRYLRPCYWEGTTFHDLKDDSMLQSWVTSIAVSGGKVYTTGYYYLGSSAHPCYWEGTTFHDLKGDLANDAHSQSIAVSDGTVYVAGSFDNGTRTVPCYWKGTELVELQWDQADGHSVYGITVSNGKVYTAGCYYLGKSTHPCYWEGTTFHDLTGSLTNMTWAHTVIVSGDTLYVVGEYYNGTITQPCYWEGGAFHGLSGDGSHEASAAPGSLWWEQHRS